MVLYVGNNEAFDSDYYITTNGFTFHPHKAYKIHLLNGTEIVNRDYDIAIIALNEAIDLQKFRQLSDGRETVVNTLCLPKYNLQLDFEYRPATFFGWGYMSGNTEPKLLQKANLSVARGQLWDCQRTTCFVSKWSPGSATMCPVSLSVRPYPTK